MSAWSEAWTLTAWVASFIAASSAWYWTGWYQGFGAGKKAEKIEQLERKRVGL